MKNIYKTLRIKTKLGDIIKDNINSKAVNGADAEKVIKELISKKTEKERIAFLEGFFIGRKVEQTIRADYNSCQNW